MDSVYAIELASFDNPYPLWYLYFLRELAGDLFLVARDKKRRVIGYIIAAPLLEVACHVLSIAVAPECRRRGVGGALLESVLELCSLEGRRAVTLEVEATNTAAQSFYRLHGFLPLRFIPDYYGPGRHALQMIRLLTPLEE